MRKSESQLPDDVRVLVKELRKLSTRGGVSEAKLGTSPRLLELAALSRPQATETELRGDARSLLERAVRATPNRRDRALLYEGLNLGGNSTTSIEGRINDVWARIDATSSDYLASESASDRFRYELLIQLAWQISGMPQWQPAETRLELARRFQDQGRWRQADEVLREVIAGPEYPAEEKQEAWRLLALSAWAEGRLEDLLTDVSSAVSLWAQVEEVDELVLTIDQLAVKLTEAEQYELASRMVSGALQHQPHGGYLWQRLGCINWYSGDLVESFSALTTALDEGEERSRVIHARGQVLAEMGKFEQAISELTEALSTHRSTHSEAYARSARAYSIGMSGDLEYALREFSDAEAVTPNNAWLHYFRGLCYHQHGMNVEAISDLE